MSDPTTHAAPPAPPADAARPPLYERLRELRAGLVTWIGVRPEHGVAMVAVPAALALADRGLEGDVAARRGDRAPATRSARQVTLVQAEHLPVIAALAGLPSVSPEALRRNVVVSGVNLLALMKQRFRIGDVVLEGTGPCAPCGRMDETIGPGGFQAVRGHGGINARVVQGGTIALGAAVELLPRREPG